MNEILIIDDEEDFGFFVKSNLQLSDEFHVNVATDGKTGKSNNKSNLRHATF